jgi:hypothetical protein
MKLHGQDWKVSVRQPFHRPVVEINEAHLPPGSSGHAHRIDLEPVVLGCNRDAPGSHVSNRVITASVPEFQLSCLGADGPR